MPARCRGPSDDRWGGLGFVPEYGAGMMNVLLLSHWGGTQTVVIVVLSVNFGPWGLSWWSSLFLGRAVRTDLFRIWLVLF